MKSLQIHIFIDHHSHSKGPLPNHRNVSPETTAVASPTTAPNNIQNPFPTFNVQHQVSTNPSHQGAPPTTNETNHRPPSRGGASSSNSSIASEADQMFTCDLCGLAGIPNRQAYKQVTYHYLNKNLVNTSKSICFSLYC